MKQATLIISKFFIILTCISLISFNGSAQITGKIDLAKDTISKLNAKGANETYMNVIRGSAQKATQQVTLPVEKLKAIVDACAAKNISGITVLFATIRDKDLAHYRKQNPEVTSTNNKIVGSQTIIFRVPRYAFAGGASSSKIDLSPKNPLMISLLSAGLIRLDPADFYEFFAGDDIYFGFGVICPPPASCD